jgi:hypothetical protein
LSISYCAPVNAFATAFVGYLVPALLDARPASVRSHFCSLCFVAAAIEFVIDELLVFLKKLLVVLYEGILEWVLLTHQTDILTCIICTNVLLLLLMKISIVVVVDAVVGGDCHQIGDRFVWASLDLVYVCA